MATSDESYQHIEHGFEPVFDERSRVLVLGSFPSVLSRANAFYYGNPQNRFWRVMAACLGVPVPPNEGDSLVDGEPAKLDELLHPVFDKKAIANAQVITKGLPASPGAATGPVVFFAEDAEKVLAAQGWGAWPACSVICPPCTTCLGCETPSARMATSLPSRWSKPVQTVAGDTWVPLTAL